MFFPDGTLPAVTRALLLGLTCLVVVCDLAKGSADFSGQQATLGSILLRLWLPCVASTPPLGSTRACGVPRHARPSVYFINRVQRASKHAEKTRRGSSVQLLPPCLEPQGFRD